MASRTPEEREAARLERERRRAKQRGDTSESAAVAPVDPVRYDPVDFTPEPEPEPAEPERAEPATPEPAAPEPTAIHEPEPEPDWGVPQPAGEAPIGERPIGVKRLGRPTGAQAIRKPPTSKRGPIGAYQRLKARPRGLPSRGRGLRRKGPIALLVLFLVLIWLLVSLFEPLKSEGSGTVRVTVPSGSTNTEVAQILADNDVIGSKFFFGMRVRLAGAELQSGTFDLRRDMSYGSAIDRLTSNARPATMRVVIPEGRSRSETAPVVRQAGVSGNYRTASRRSSRLNPRSYGAPQGATLEGFLFPATYELRPGASAATLVREQLDAFRANIATVSLTRARRRNLDTFDVITIASMIEREASIASERPRIAAVIYNRLRQGMPLGIDATTRFAVGNWDRPLRASELASSSPYNTRNRTGLPPGPIGSPGLASIRAAAAPASGGYLYYVVRPCGNGAHNFSTTEAEFQRDVAAYNAARARNGGNDPSDASDC